MLTALVVRNYALLKNIELSFEPGFSVITGETGAGKSILLGALGLALGRRADSTALFDSAEKCVIEAVFQPPEDVLSPVFKEHGLEPEFPVILRRIISPNGKSRLFLNEAPVTQEVAKAFGEKLIDIHSQHQNLLLKDAKYRLRLLDLFAGNLERLREYGEQFRYYHKLESRLDEMTRMQEEAVKQQDYHRFLFEQLEQAQLMEGEQEQLEQEIELSSHVEEIKAGLSEALGMLGEDETSAETALNAAAGSLGRIVKYSENLKQQRIRLENMLIDLEDIRSELRHADEGIDFDPERLRYGSDRLAEIYSLQKRHQVDTVAELITIRDDLQTKLQSAAEHDFELEKLKSELGKSEAALAQAALELRKKRLAALEDFAGRIQAGVRALGMPKARFVVRLAEKQAFSATGIDEAEFLFAANPDMPLSPAEKTASGGELSRLMLTLKSLAAASGELPAIIFDEIDTGVSGAVAEQMGKIMRQMGNSMQILAITHLPQVAGKGDRHFRVSKAEDAGRTVTDITPLSQEERVQELASMLSGEKVTHSAVTHAEHLLEQE